MFKKILVATDGSQLSKKAAKLGMDLVKKFDAELQIIYVIDQRVFFFPHDIQVLTPENPYFSILEDLRSNAQSVLSKLSTEARKKKISFESKVLEGSVVDVINKAAKDMKAELLIVGAHGETGAARGLLGSTAQALSTHSPCSLLIVRAK